MTTANTDGALASRVGLMFTVSGSAIVLKFLIIGDKGPRPFGYGRRGSAYKPQALD